jgi:hypothetical protein
MNPVFDIRPFLSGATAPGVCLQRLRIAPAAGEMINLCLLICASHKERLDKNGGKRMGTRTSGTCPHSFPVLLPRISVEVEVDGRGDAGGALL